MTKVWIGTNWKMTKTISEGLAYTRELKKLAESITPNIELCLLSHPLRLYYLFEKSCQVHV